MVALKSVLSMIPLALVLLFLSTYCNAKEYSHWMADNWEILKDRPLRTIVIPGTHDSGTYDLELDTRSRDINGVASFLAAIPGINDVIVREYAEAQSLSIYDQLLLGVRYIDLRFQHTISNGEDAYRIHHSLLGPEVTDIFDDIKNFLDEPGHSKEIIVLRLNAMRSQSVDSDGEYKPFSEEENHEFLRLIFDHFKGYMVPRSDSGFNITPAEIVAGGNQLIVYYQTSRKEITKVKFRNYYRKKADRHAREIGEDGKYLWHDFENKWFGQINKSQSGDSGYPSPSHWKSEDSLQNDWIKHFPKPTEFSTTLKGSYIAAMAIGMGDNAAMYLNTLSPDDDTIGWDGLNEASEFANPRMIPHIIALPRDQVNIVAVDFIEYGGLVEEAIKLNKNPARVTIKLNKVLINDDASACGDGDLEESCDFYPIFTINGNVSEEPDVLANKHQRGRVFDDINNVIRGESPPENLGIFTFGWDQKWIYTTAVPWDQRLKAQVNIWDDDNLGNEDDHVQKLSYKFREGFLEDLRRTGNLPYTETVTYAGRRNDDGEYVGAEVSFDVIIESWNLPLSISANNDSVSTNEGDVAPNSGIICGGFTSSISVRASKGQVTLSEYLPDAQCRNWNWSFQTTDGPSDSQSIWITASDNQTDEIKNTRFELEVLNVAPTVTIDAIVDEANNQIGTDVGEVDIAHVNLEQTIQASFTDPGIYDYHTVTVDWGDGQVNSWASTSPFNNTHHYSQTGTYAISVTVVDNDGGSGNNSDTIAVVEASTAVSDSISDLGNLLTNPTVTPTAAVLIQAAIDDLNGMDNGKGANGSLEMLIKSNENSALVKLSHALELLQESDAMVSMNLYNMISQLVLTAKSTVAELIENVRPKATQLKDQKKIIEAELLVAKGDKLFSGGDNLGAVNTYRFALTKLPKNFNIKIGSNKK